MITSTNDIRSFEIISNGQVLIKRVGRTGQSTEFVEFHVPQHQKNFVAQKGSHGNWFVFLVDPSPNGVVQTLLELKSLPEHKEMALQYALEAATTLAQTQKNGWRKLSNRELAGLPSHWENPTVDTRHYYQNVLSAFEVDQATFLQHKAKGGLCQMVTGKDQARYIIA